MDTDNQPTDEQKKEPADQQTQAFRYSRAFEVLFSEASDNLKQKVTRAKLESTYKDSEVETFVRNVIEFGESDMEL